MVGAPPVTYTSIPRAVSQLAVRCQGQDGARRAPRRYTAAAMTINATHSQSQRHWANHWSQVSSGGRGYPVKRWAGVRAGLISWGIGGAAPLRVLVTPMMPAMINTSATTSRHTVRLAGWVANRVMLHWRWNQPMAPKTKVAMNLSSIS